MLEEKKATGETGKAYQTGFQITEVIPSVIDSPIATYRISVGSSWEGNYKGERERCAARERWGERKRDVCGENGIERSAKHEDNEEREREKRRSGILRKVVLSLTYSAG